MGRLTVDTTEARSFEPVSPGPYAMTVDEISDLEEGPKAHYVWWYFKFDDPNIEKIAGRARRVYPVEGEGAGFFREAWKAATGEDIPLGVTIDVDTDHALGKPVLVQIGNEEYEGRLQNVVERVSPRN